jgi:WD40 repeat protein
MLRTLVVLILLGGVGFVAYAWATSGPEKSVVNSNGDPKKREVVKPPNPGPEEEDKDPPQSRKDVSVVKVPRDAPLIEPLTVPDSRVTIIDSQAIGASRQGQILVLGKEVIDGRPRQKPRDPMAGQEELVPVDMPFLAIQISAEEANRLGPKAYKVPGEEGKFWRRWVSQQDPVEPDKLRVLSETKQFERIWPGMPVAKDELLGLVDPSVARNDTQIKIAKLDASKAEWRASGKTKDEALKRYESLLEASRRAPGSVAPEEIRGARLTWERYIEDENAKFQAINVAKQELQQAQTLLKLHEIRATVPGVVKEITKNLGESVKEQDQVLLIQNPYVLRVEGFVEVQHARKLAKGMPVVVEPVLPDAPGVVLRAHREAINAVAVSRGANPVVVSASEDHSVRIWSVKFETNAQTGKTTWEGRELWRLEHPSAVRSVACTGPGAEKNLCLSGTADGVGRIWNLDDPRQEPVELSEPHRGAINAVAFSADGKLCATGGEDRTLSVWSTETGKPLSRYEDAHGGAITSLDFTPAGLLVSNGRDHYLRTWSLQDGRKLTREDNGPLGGNVEDLGTFHNAQKGKEGETLVLIDQGRYLRVLSLGDRSTRGVITSSSETANFTTFARFSPDGRTVLTAAGSSDTRLQLWRNPALSQKKRAAELRQYVWTESPTTCAAFAPQAPFIVTGTRDRNVVVWGMPTEEELRDPVTNATIINVGEILENSTRPVRVIADVFKPTPGLLPNGTATMVVHPK